MTSNYFYYQTYLCNSPPEIRTHSSYNLHSNVSTQWKRHPCNKNQEDRNFFLNKCSFTIDLPILDFFLKKRKNIPSSNLPLTISVSSPRHRRRLPPPPLPPHPLLSLCHRWQWRLTQPSQFFGFAILSYLIQWIFFSSTFPLQKTLAINASIWLHTEARSLKQLIK